MGVQAKYAKSNSKPNMPRVSNVDCRVPLTLAGVEKTVRRRILRRSPKLDSGLSDG